jgi:hypothetical protein
MRTCTPSVAGALVGTSGNASRWVGAGRGWDDLGRCRGGGADDTDAPCRAGLGPRGRRRRVRSGRSPGAPRGAVRRSGREPAGALLTGVSSAPVDDGPPVAASVRDPALTGLRGTGIVVSCAQGALGLLPFAVRLGDLRVAGVRLLAIARDGGPEGGGAESRGATEFGPTSGRSREGRHARPRGPDGTSRPESGSPPAGPAPQHDQQSNTFESTTQRR